MPQLTASPRGWALRGLVRPGGGGAEVPDGVVLGDATGRVVALGPQRYLPVPGDLPVLGGPDAVVMPGIVDAHVHLAFADPAQVVAAGVVGVRDLGAPPEDVRRMRSGAAPPVVVVSGPMLTAPGGYPSRTWGAGGFARAVADPPQGARAVAELAAQGVHVIKLALEDAGGAPVPDLATARAIVDAAHRAGLGVTCHALSADMVARALDAEVDEFCHTPVEVLPAATIARLAEAAISVVSTLATFADASASAGATSLANARALVAAGVRLIYGTDLGNAGTRPGAEPRELDRLVAAGLAPAAALHAATSGSAGALGLRGRDLGTLKVGSLAAAVVLPADPLLDFSVLRRPLAAVAGGRLLTL